VIHGLFSPFRLFAALIFVKNEKFVHQDRQNRHSAIKTGWGARFSLNRRRMGLDDGKAFANTPTAMPEN
jgi:hypothetical protein